MFLSAIREIGKEMHIKTNIFDYIPGTYLHKHKNIGSVDMWNMSPLECVHMFIGCDVEKNWLNMF